MATQTKSVGTVTENNFYGYGTFSWANANNIKVSDDSKAVATRGLGDGFYPNTLYCTNFGFTIPAGSVITKITVKIEAMSDALTAYLDWCNLLYYGNPSLLRVSGFYAGDYDPAQPLTSTDVEYSLNPVNAGDGNLWGVSWTPDIINDTTFGCVFDCYVPDVGSYVAVDHVSITVDYEEGTPGGACRVRSCDLGYEDMEQAIRAAIGKIAEGPFEDCAGIKITPEIKECDDLTDLKDCGQHYTLEEAFKAALADDGCGKATLRVFVIFPEEGGLR